MKMEKLGGHRRIIASKIFDSGIELSGVHCDSRRCDPQTGFFALPGLQTDGHRFVDNALAAGIPALIVSRREVYETFATATRAPTPGLGGVFLSAPDRASLGELAGDIYGWPDRRLTLLGVTGTNGKTTVVHMIAQMLASLGQECAMVGTLGLSLGGQDIQGHPAGHTTPEAPDLHAFFNLCLERGAGTVAMEVSSHALEMERTRGMTFAAAGFTNLTRDHLDYHGDMDAYQKAKYRLFLPGEDDPEHPHPRGSDGPHHPRGVAANMDDPAGAELAARWNREADFPLAVTVGLGDGPKASEQPHVSLTGMHREGAAMTGTLVVRLPEGGEAQAPFRLPLLGRFNLSNWLVAAGMLLAARPTSGGGGAGGGLPEALTPEELPGVLAAAAAHCTGAPGRFERVPLDAPFTVIVDYAHTPDALDNLLATARTLAWETGGKLRVAFGAGGDRDRHKRPMMGTVAEQRADELILTNDNPRHESPEVILAEIEGGLTGRVPARSIIDRTEAVHALLELAREGDVIVIAGKGDEPYQDIAGVKHPFDDRQVVRRWAAERGIGVEEER